jgi:hypothetical protein
MGLVNKLHVLGFALNNIYFTVITAYVLCKYWVIMKFFFVILWSSLWYIFGIQPDRRARDKVAAWPDCTYMSMKATRNNLTN